MANNIFAVVFTEEAERGVELLRDTYPKSGLFELADNVVLVVEEGLTADVAKASSLTKDKGEEGVRGAVFRLNGSYTGYAQGSLWEWLEEAEDVG